MTFVRISASLAACSTLLALLCASAAQAQQAGMTFFVTSQGPGKGADLGGLAGADGHASSSPLRRGRPERPGTPICRRKALAR